MRISLFLLRVALGWLYFYAGITKVLNPAWSAAGYLKSAKTFPALYQWFAAPANIGWVNFLNEWGLTLVGVALILGIGVRWAAAGGIFLMALYYFVVLQFPHAGANSYLVDDHVIYSLALLVLAASKSESRWGLGGLLSRSH